MPGRRKSLEAATAIITGSRHTQSEIPLHLQDRTVYIPENGIDPKRFNKRAKQDISGPLRACFIGRLVPYKGPDMLLEAAGPALHEGRLILDIVGDGPMRNELEAQVKQAGLEKSVTFHGMLDHHAVQDVAVQSNLLTFPSIREFGGGVVIEAMSLGVVPLIVDYAGPGELVGLKTGFKVPIGTRSEIVATFGAQLEAILADPSALPEMGAASQEYVQSKFTWEAKASQILDVYNWALADRSLPTPDFF
jgi:glycosyltransferase involved in cell wall biosynthesis